MSCNANEMEMYQAYVNTLFDQWLRRETWCAVVGSVPDRQRRHFPGKSNHQIRITGGCFHPKPYFTYNGPSAFPPPRRLFPSVKNISNLQGYF